MYITSRAVKERRQRSGRKQIILADHADTAQQHTADAQDTANLVHVVMDLQGIEYVVTVKNTKGSGQDLKDH